MIKIFNTKKLLAAVIAANMVFWNVPLAALASEISGITPTGNTYNINAAKVSGSTGFRHYEKFNLDNGHTANLIYNNYTKFVNLVDNKININGIVNTMKDGNFFNGHAIFVSPEGMVVGASGVLNVGALSVLTPSSSKFGDFKNAYSADNLSDYEFGADKYKALITDSTGEIKINGRVISRGDVNLYGSDIAIGDGTNRATILAGVQNLDQTFDNISQDTFNALVSNNITNANSFALQNGKIQIVASSESKLFDAAGNIKSKIDIKKADIGANEIDISAKAEVDRASGIDLAEAKIDIEDSYITGDTVSVVAKTVQKKSIDPHSITDNATGIAEALVDVFAGTFGPNPTIASLWGTSGRAESEINIKDSHLTAFKVHPDKLPDNSDNPAKGTSVYIHAEASSETNQNANLLTPSIVDFIKDEKAHISEFFSDGVYTGFEGPRSSAIINVEKSDIKAAGNNSGNIEISTEASSSLTADNTLLALILPMGLYGVGTGTVSKALIKGSNLEAKNGDIDVNSISTNENAVTLSNGSLITALIEDSVILMLLNNNVVTDTEALITAASDNTESKVDTKNLTVLASNLSTSEAEVGMTAISNKNVQDPTDKRGSVGVSVIGVFNRSNKQVKSIIQNSDIKTKEDTSVVAQNLTKVKNTAEVEVEDDEPGSEQPEPTKFEAQKWLKDNIDEKLTSNLFDKIFNGAEAESAPDKAPFLQAGGAAVWSNTNNITTAIIKESKVEAGNVKVEADTIDLIANKASSKVKGSGNFGVGLAFIYNDQKNTTTSTLDKAEIEADDVVVNAITELPINAGTLTFGSKLPFKIFGVEKLELGAQFASEANGKWDISGVTPTPKQEDGDPDFELTGVLEQSLEDTYKELKPKFKLSGFFNNYATSAMQNENSSNVSISGSVIYNTVTNNTTAQVINGSKVTINTASGSDPQGGLVVNAVNSVIGYNAAGLVDFLVKKVNGLFPWQKSGDLPVADAGFFGIGADVIWDTYNNNATAKIDSSTIDAEKGAVDVNSATEQAYLTINVTGGKSEKFGIDGSVNVQNLNGDTIAQISNIAADKFSAKDISVNAGKANVKTTSGNVKRDDDTNQISWKTQDSTAQGDDKYIREAKDTISNIVAQGAWTSQYQEVNNTVQTSSAGVAVGASVNVSNINRNVKSIIENAILKATDNVIVNADNYIQRIGIEVAAAFSGGVKQKTAGTDVQQAANNAQDPQDADDENIFGNLFDHEDEYMRNPVGNALAAVQGQFNMSAAGAVDITDDKTKVEASIIKKSEITVGNELKVTSNREAKNIAFDGGLGISKKVGAGAAVNYYKQEGSVKSFIDDSTVKYTGTTPKLTMDAKNKNWILDIAIGAGVASNKAAQDKGFQAAIGGSASVNTLKPTIEAYINKSTISMAENKTGSIATTLNAKSDVDIINIAGGGTYMHGGTFGLSAGAAFNYNNIKNTISTYIKDSTLKNISKLTMLSDADNNERNWAVAGSIVRGTEGLSFAFNGAVDVDYIHDTISSNIIKSTITASDDIDIQANSNTDNLSVAGSFDVTTAQSGMGVNGDVVVEVYRNSVTSSIDKDSKILKAKDVKVAASSTEKSNVVPIGASVATQNQFLMAAANVAVNVVDNTVKAIASGKFGTSDDNNDDTEKVNKVTVSAYDETTLYTRGGTVAVASADAIANVAGSVNVDKIDKTVEAKIKDADIKATGDVTVQANSINSLGGTKTGDIYTRDDVTTDAYREKMLTKNSNGYYNDLKLGSSFLNWNMFYDLSAGSIVSVAGAGIGKVIENTVTAEVNKSNIEANNLNVSARDYSIKNIIAGSISASSKVAVSPEVIYTRDNSTTSAFIANGSKLDITNNIEMLANNTKDYHEILVAGAGAGKGAITANVVLNNVKDTTTAKIDNGSTSNEIKADNLNINSNEDINGSHIIVSAAGSGGVALAVQPTINKYEMTTEASINNAKIKDALVDMDAQSSLGTLDVAVGIAGVSKGLAGVGNAIKNVYTNTVKSYINNAVIDTTRNINIDSNSIIDSSNWIGSIAVAGQGVDLVANLLLNDINSTLEAGIKNSNIEKSGSIEINSNKEKEDTFDNRGFVIGVVGQGVSATVNLIKNSYNNTVTSYLDNTSSTEISALEVNSYSNRWLDNLNIGLGFAAEGLSANANAVVNDLNSTTRSYIDAKDKTLNVNSSIDVNSKDTVASYNRVAIVTLSGLAAGLGANINLFYANNLAKSEIMSAINGQINSSTANVNSELVNAYNSLDVDISAGVAAIPVDVQLIEMGKRTGGYSDSEKKTKIPEYVDKAKNMEPESLRTTPTTPASNLKTGAIARIDGNIKTTDDIKVKAKTNLKGIDSDKNFTDQLQLKNVKVSATAAGINVAYRDVNNSNNTLAEIAGGKIESTGGNVEVKAESNSDVLIKNTEVNAHGIHATGGSALYKNSSETVAQIKNATVKGEDVSVSSDSTSKSKIDATHVIAALAGVVTVDLAEASDTNKSVALITSTDNKQTNIEATGALNVTAKANTDLSAEKTSVPVQIVNIASVSRNRADVNTIARAIIENVNGEIKAKNLNIKTHYDVMNVYSKANVVSVLPLSIVDYTDTGSFMKADFKSGIDSPTALTLNVSDTTNITTALDSGSGNGMVSKSDAPSVSVSVVGLYCGSFANAENEATSTTVLNVKENTTKDLNIDQHLKSSATATGDSTVVSGGGVSAIAADSKDISTMTLDIAGTNTVTNNAIIEATHESKINSDLSGFKLGILVSGARLRIDSDLESNSTATIGGNFNASIAKVAMNTVRESIMSRSSGSGGFINVSNPQASNKLTGNTILNISNINTNTQSGINNWEISNKAQNTFDTTSSNGSGGFINVAVDKSNLTFNTKTITNIENSNINSDAKVKLEVENKSIIKDEATGTGGGFVAVSTNNVENDYKSSALLNFENTKLSAKDLEIKSLSDISSKNDDYINYAGTAGGFVAVEDMDLTNTFTQTSEINLEGSVFDAANKAIVKALTSSKYKQKIETFGRGFVAVPRAYNKLQVTNNDKITLDKNSKIKAGDELDVNLDSNNTLGVHTVSDDRNFEGKPSAYSWLYLTVNNTLDNSGSMEAGNLADINFMTNSTNNLTQYAHSECHAAIASTNEGGILSRTINNALNVNTNADITSGKDVEISYSSGKMNTSSIVSWKTISYALFGIPISNSDSYSVESPVNTYSLKDNGKIVAGQGNGKYMKINRDGTVDKETLVGFYDDDYTLSGGQSIPGQQVKDRILASLQAEIANIGESISEADAAINYTEAAMEEYDTKIANSTAELNELTNLINNGAILKNITPDIKGNSDFSSIVHNDIKTEVVGSASDNKITEAQYNTIMKDYADRLKAIEAENKEIFIENAKPENIDNQKEYIVRPTILEFIDSGSYDLTAAQKTTVANGYTKVTNNLTSTDIGELTVYKKGTETYVGVFNPKGTGTSQTCDEITDLNEEIANYIEQRKPYADRHTASVNQKALLNNEKSGLESEYAAVQATPASHYEIYQENYQIVFNDIKPKASHIHVDGADNSKISGTGIFSVATSGLKIDNYSTRTLVFNAVDTGSSIQSGLYIAGKDNGIFANKEQIVSGNQAWAYMNNQASWSSIPKTGGVHYVTGGVGLVGITINNYYDVNHPFAGEFDIPQPTTPSQIYFCGYVKTKGDVNIWNESGHIAFLGTSTDYNNATLTSTNGAVALRPVEDESNPGNYLVKENDTIFARDGVSMFLDGPVKVKGNIKTGYSARSITITEDMLKPENLITDETSGEKNMINLGGNNISPYLNATNNIKAIYKNGEIYLYNVPEQNANNGVSFTSDDPAKVNITGHITMSDGYQNITIDNQTSSPMTTADVMNTKIMALMPSNVYDAYKDTTVTKNTIANAVTSINSKGKLTLNGLVYNNVKNVLYNIEDGGTLNITANNGLDVKKQYRSEQEVHAIRAGGTTNITIDKEQGNIDGKIETKGKFTITNKGKGTLTINGTIDNDSARDSQDNITNSGEINIISKDTATLNINGNVTEIEGAILAQTKGQTNITSEIVNKKGNIAIVSSGLNASEASKIKSSEGDISITNNASQVKDVIARMTMTGDIIAENGTITISNNGDGATLTGSISDEQGDLVIVNTKDDMLISAILTHDTVHTDKNGYIRIENSGGDLNIISDVTTSGAGKNVNNKQVAIIIDNQSQTDGLLLSSNVSARVGDIIIKNYKEDFTSVGSITSSETGDIKITNLGGKAQIGSAISNADGSTSINNNGNNLIFTGSIDNTNGSTEITNEKGVTHIYGDVINRGGDLSIINNGSFTEISHNIENELLSVVDSNNETIKKSGNITLRNNNGHFRILESAIVNNTTDKAENGISIMNFGDQFQLDADVNSFDKGYISITNNGSIANITGDIYAKVGSIGVTNSNPGKLTMTGDVTNNKGNIEIHNNSSDGAEIKGAITGEDGDITIANNGGNLKITSDITHNYVSNANGSGMISIINAPAAGKVEIQSTIATYGQAKQTDDDGLVAILIDNKSTTDGMSVGQALSARVGKIIIRNAADDLLTYGTISNTEEGSISITNGGKDITSTAAISVKSGDAEIINNGTGKAQIGGSITNEYGNTSVINNGNNLVYTGTINNTHGDVTIENDNGVIHMHGPVTNTGGDISVTNNGNYTQISGAITNNVYSDSEEKISGSIEISNASGNMIISNTATITNTSDDPDVAISITNGNNSGFLKIESDIISTNKGDIEIQNNGNDNTTISGAITANVGNIAIGNTNGGNTSITGAVGNTKGDISIANTNSGNMTIDGAITAPDGIVTITNNDSGNLNINGGITNSGGVTISQENSKELTINSDINEGVGDVTVNNINGGDIKITTDASITVDNGDISIYNDGTSDIYQAGPLTVATELGGTISVINTGGSIYSYASVITMHGDVELINKTNVAGLIIQNVVGTMDGDVFVYNQKGNLVLVNDQIHNPDDPAASSGCIINLSSPDSGHGITIANVENSDAVGMFLDGYILNTGGGSIDIVNYGSGEAGISGIIENISGDINIANFSQTLYLTGEIDTNNGNITVSNSGQGGILIGDTSDISTDQGRISITNSLGDFKMEYGAHLSAENSASSEEPDISLVNYPNLGKMTIAGDIDNTGINGIKISNEGSGGLEIDSTADITNKQSYTTITNKAGDFTVKEDAQITNTQSGNMKLENEGGKFTIAGLVEHLGTGNIDIDNTGANKLDIQTTARINSANGDIGLSNTSTEGIDIQGLINSIKKNIKIKNSDSDVRIGEFDTENDNYISAAVGNVIIEQTNGNILNSIVDTSNDPNNVNKHQNYDLGNPQQSYKTLIATGGDLEINVTDGNIGYTDNTNPGYSIDANTRDWTDSININTKGSVIARAVNENSTDKRLVNIRAKESNLNIKDVTSDGNVILTAADWKQADTRPTPNDTSYYKGYSVLNAATGNNSAITGQMISVIASDNIGSSSKKLTYTQDTLNAPNSSVSFEAENDINITARDNSPNPTKIYQLISKHGSIDIDMESDADIFEITADGGLKLTQKAQNLTIRNLGKVGKRGESLIFDDILYPHDDILLSSDSGKGVVPKYVDIKVLDAMDTPGRSESNLKIYSGYVKGNNGDNDSYYPDNTRLADYTLMADNIYANSDKAPNSSVPTKENPNGYKQTQTSYTDADFGGDGSTVYYAEGLNSYGKGKELVVDVTGVAQDVVNFTVQDAKRNNYDEIKHSDYTTPSKFKNEYDRLAYYENGYKANDVVLSINDYVNGERNVSIDTIYANNAYINTPATNLKVQDGIINNYAELRNKDKLAVVDNDYRRLVRPSDIQLYTKKTGSFNLTLDRTINIKTSAPTVYNDPHELVNGYHSEWNFFNKGVKDSKDVYERLDEKEALKQYEENQKRLAMRYDTLKDDGLHSNYKIYDISTTGALIKDGTLKIGNNILLDIRFDDVDIMVEAVVVNSDGIFAGVEFKGLPDDVKTKILYRYMLKDAMKITKR